MPADLRALDPVVAQDLVTDALRPGGILAVFHPIVRLADREVVGYEALSRFPGSGAAPDVVFAAAASLGLRPDLEVAALEAIAAIGPPPGDALLFVNTSPSVLGDPRMIELRRRLPERLVLELTEQDAVEDYDALRVDLAPWTTSGVRLAIDDTGSGYASLQHAIQLLPDFLKLDRDLIREVERDRTRQALVRSLVTFAREIGASVIAEGVERPAQLTWLRDADVALAQGFLFCRPGAAWPQIESRRPTSREGRPVHPSTAAPVVDRSRLVQRLSAATDARGAADAAVDHLFRRGDVMPSVYLEEGGRLRCYAQRGLWQVLDGMNPLAGVTGLAYRTGRPQRIADVSASPDYLQAVPGVVAELCVPLVADGVVVGAVNVDSVVSMAPDLEHELRVTAELLGERLAELDLVSSRVRTGLLESAIGRLLTSRTWNEGVEALLESAREVSGLDSAMLALGSGDHLEVAPAGGPLAEALRRTEPVELVQLADLLTRLTSCYSTGEPTGRRFVGTEALRRAGARAVIAVPVIAPDRRVGMLVVAHTQPQPLSLEDIQPLELLGSLGGAVLEAASTIEALREAASCDPLTGIGNHRGFYDALGREAEAVTPRVLVVLDVDRFKQLNDTHGHPAGDAVLRSVAAALTDVVRSGDAVFRIGGDEFAVIARPDRIEPEDVAALAHRLRAAVDEVLLAFDTSASVGACAVATDDDAASAYFRADAELYLAKRARRTV